MTFVSRLSQQTDLAGEPFLWSAHSFGTSGWFAYGLPAPTHRTVSCECWRRSCFIEWASCCSWQHLWGTVLEEAIADLITLTTLTFVSRILALFRGWARWNFRSRPRPSVQDQNQDRRLRDQDRNFSVPVSRARSRDLETTSLVATINLDVLWHVCHYVASLDTCYRLLSVWL